MAFFNTVQTLTGESLDEAHWPNCVVVIRVFFCLWHFKLAESTKALREGYLADQLNQAVIDVMLVDALSAVQSAPSGVDEGSSEEPSDSGSGMPARGKGRLDCHNPVQTIRQGRGSRGWSGRGGRGLASATRSAGSGSRLHAISYVYIVCIYRTFRAICTYNIVLDVRHRIIQM